MTKNIAEVPLAWTTVYANSESERFQPATPWMTAAEVAELRGTFDVAARTGQGEVALGFQTAQVENNPDAHVVVGAFANSDGVKYPTGFTAVSSNMAGKQIVRLGWVTRNASGGGSTVNPIRVGGLVQVVKKCLAPRSARTRPRRGVVAAAVARPEAVAVAVGVGARDQGANRTA